MRKLYATCLLSLLLISNLSLGSVQHYCAGHLMDTQIQFAHFNYLNCGMENEIKSTCDFENSELKADDCCENRANFLVLDNLDNVKQFALSVNPTFFLSWVNIFLLPVDFYNSFQSTITQLQNVSVTSNLNVLFQVFII